MGGDLLSPSTRERTVLYGNFPLRWPLQEALVPQSSYKDFNLLVEKIRFAITLPIELIDLIADYAHKDFTDMWAALNRRIEFPLLGYKGWQVLLPAYFPQSTFLDIRNSDTHIPKEVLREFEDQQYGGYHATMLIPPLPRDRYITEGELPSLPAGFRRANIGEVVFFINLVAKETFRSKHIFPKDEGTILLSEKFKGQYMTAHTNSDGGCTIKTMVAFPQRVRVAAIMVFDSNKSH